MLLLKVKISYYLMLYVTTYSWYLKFSLYINTGEALMLRLVLTLQEQSYNIYLQTVIDHFTGSFNEFNCLRKQASYLWLNIVFYVCFFFIFDTIRYHHKDWYLWLFLKPGGDSYGFWNKYLWLISLYESVWI